MKVGYADDATQCLQPKQVARAFVICQYMCKYIIPQSRRRIGVAVTRLRGCNAGAGFNGRANNLILILRHV